MCGSCRISIRGLAICQLFQSSGYSIYVLITLLLTYLLNQLDRYILGIVTKPLAQDIHYGNLVCMNNDSFGDSGITCNATIEQSCVQTSGCEWNYNGQGFQYELLVGPVFTVTFTLAGIFLGVGADMYNRKVLLSICLIFWSSMTVLTGLVQEYWQLALLRFGLGIGEAGCTPFAASLIGDYFVESLRGTALGFYNWGIYVGYSLSYAFGNFITDANILGQGWRWAFYLSGIPGVLLGFIILATVKEPERTSRAGNAKDSAQLQELLGGEVTRRKKVWTVIKIFLKPSLLMLCLAGSIRNAAGYVWAYNTQIFFESLGQTSVQIGHWMSWIPLVGGSIGVLVGGFVSDRVVVRRGLNARVAVIVVSLVLSAPFAAGALLLPFPWAYLSLVPANLIGECWVGITLVVVIEMVPTALRTTCIAVYLFIITNIGGNMPLLVPPIQEGFQALHFSYVDSLRAALLILYPGLYLLGALLFLLTWCVMRYEMRKGAEAPSYVHINSEDEADDDIHTTSDSAHIHTTSDSAHETPSNV